MLGLMLFNILILRNIEERPKKLWKLSMSEFMTKLLWIKRKLNQQKLREDLMVRGEYVTK